MTFWLGLFGAIALLLWGLRMVRTGIMRAYGPILRKVAINAEGRKTSPFIAGCMIAILLQSSSATAMIVAGFSANAILGPATAFLTILGADLGTALAALIVSQKLPFLSPLMLTIGVFGFLVTGAPKWRALSRAFTGIGLILLALSLIGETSTALAREADFVRVIDVLADYPLIMVFAGLALSYLAHSSLAMVLFGASLAASGVVEPLSAIYFVFGANIGSGLLPHVANINSRKGARIPVLANLIIRTICALAACLVLPWIDQIGWFAKIPLIPSTLTAHICLNIVVAMVGLVVAKQLLALVNGMIPDDKPDPNHIDPRYLDTALVSRPAEALASAKREALVMAEIALRMLDNVLPLFREKATRLNSEIETLEESLDRLFNAIKSYLADILQSPLDEREARKAMDLLTFVTNMEHVGDVVDRNLLALSSKKTGLHAQFSTAGMAEIESLHNAVIENFELAIKVFLSEDPDLARQLHDAKANIRKLEQKSIATHIDRLGTGLEESVQTSELHLDVLRDLRRINSHLTSTAYPVLMASGEVPKTKWKRKRAT